MSVREATARSGDGSRDARSRSMSVISMAASSSSDPRPPATDLDGERAPGHTGLPRPDNPVRLYVAGDADAGTFGPYLQTLMKKTGMVDVTLDYKVSSGLSRPDFFDWPARFAEQLPKVNPGIVVLTFGGNDAQGL